MAQQKFEIFCIFMMLIAVTHSGLVARRQALPQGSSGEDDEDRDNEYGWNAETGDDADDYRNGENPGSLHPISEPNEYPDADYPGEGIHENEIGGAHDNDGFQGGPFDAEEDLDESFGGHRDPDVPDDDDDEDESGGDGELVDETDNLPDGADFGVGTELFGSGSFFHNPFFSLKEVREYFHELEKALQLVFSQTMDEARLLNGTYANTTEEEIDINGKKYVVQKSILKGGNNHSAIYIETLSSKPREDGSQGINGMQIGNETIKNNSTSR